MSKCYLSDHSLYTRLRKSVLIQEQFKTFGSHNKTFQRLILNFTRQSLQWAHKYNLSTPQSIHERTRNQSTWLYHVVVARGERTSHISWSFKLIGDDDKLHTLSSCEHLTAVQIPYNVYGPRFHSLNGDNTLSCEVLNQTIY